MCVGKDVKVVLSLKASRDVKQQQKKICCKTVKCVFYLNVHYFAFIIFF